MLRIALYLLALGSVAIAEDKPVAPPADESGTNVPAAAHPTGPMPFTATAYSTKGNTVKGVQTQPGIVAADPKILPLGSTIRVSDAGKYSGLYVVTDVGTAIVGRRIDIYMAELEDARAFGKKDVTVELLKPGDNVKFKPETTTEIPKSALAPAQKKDAAPIPSNKVPAGKEAVQVGREVKAEEKAQQKAEEKATDKPQDESDVAKH
ncbi:MAG TPA: 3D domain-containing protein [Bryobacteraceae bacterium]